MDFGGDVVLVEILMPLSNSKDANSHDELIETVVRSSGSQGGEIGISEVTGATRILALLAG
jgi:hypothetical protein